MQHVISAYNPSTSDPDRVCDRMLWRKSLIFDARYNYTILCNHGMFSTHSIKLSFFRTSDVWPAFGLAQNELMSCIVAHLALTSKSHHLGPSFYCLRVTRKRTGLRPVITYRQLAIGQWHCLGWLSFSQVHWVHPCQDSPRRCRGCQVVETGGCRRQLEASGDIAGSRRWPLPWCAIACLRASPPGYSPRGPRTQFSSARPGRYRGRRHQAS